MKKEKIIIDRSAHIQNLCCEVDAAAGVCKAFISFDNLGYGVIKSIDEYGVRPVIEVKRNKIS